jgi:hypothetical protein
MTSMKKLLLTGACAGLLAFTAAPVLAAGPVVSPKGDAVTNSDGAIHKTEYRWDGHRWVWYDPPRYNSWGYGPGGRTYGRDYWGDRDDNPPGPRGGPGTNWENPPGPRGGPGASPDRRYPQYWYGPRTY